MRATRLINNSHHYIHSNGIACTSNHTRHALRIDTPWNGAVHINENCVANEVNSLIRRHLNTTNKTNVLSAKCVFDYFREAYPPFDVKCFTLDEVLKRKTPQMRRRYIKAINDLSTQGMKDKDYRVSSFIKLERMNYPDDEVHSDVLKPPRMIQAHYETAAQKSYCCYSDVSPHSCRLLV